MNNGRGFLSLSTKVTMMVVVIILVCTIPIGIFAYIRYRSDSIEKHGEKAVAIAQSLALFIDADEFVWAMEHNVMNEYYEDLQEKILRMRDEVGALFLFSGIADENIGLIAFMEGEVVTLGDIFPDDDVFPPEFYNAQRGVPAFHPEIIDTGVAGLYAVCAYVPIRDRNMNTVGIVGININVTDVLAQSDAFARTMFIIVTAIILIVIWIPILWTRRYVRKPLNALCDAAYKIANGMDSNLTPFSSNDEIGRLSTAFRLMEDEIDTTVRETEKRSQGIVEGNLQSGKSNFVAKGGFQRFIDCIDHVAGSVFQYLENLSCAIIILDTEYRFTFINGFARNQGYDPNYLLGKSLREALPPAEAEALMKNFGVVDSTKKLYSYKIEMISPKGDPFNADQVIIPIMDNRGNIDAYLVFGYETTAMVQAQKRAEKINEYQKIEAGSIIRELQENLSQGVLQFNFKLEPHDNDTAEAAAAYRQIGETLENAITFIKSYVDEISQLLHEFTDGNFDVTIKHHYMGNFDTIRDSLDKLIISIGSLISEIRVSTAQVEAGAEEISRSAQELMASIEKQAAAMSEVTAAVDNITEKTQKNAKDAQSANGLSTEVQEVANIGSKHMRDMSAVMEEIKQSSSEIAKVANIIENIAFQTNLLALNASVEAARAGEHGKGFSVVADEVRNLAGRSATAAKEATEMIGKSLNRVDEGVAKSEQTAAALSKIVEVTADVTKVMSSIAEASNEQAAEIMEIQNSMRTIQQIASDNSSSVQTNASISEELSGQANVLLSLVERFRTKK